MFAGTAVVMGVSGTGKTEVASRLAEQLGAFLALMAARSGQDCENDALRGSDQGRSPGPAASDRASGVAPCTAVIK